MSKTFPRFQKRHKTWNRLNFFFHPNHLVNVAGDTEARSDRPDRPGGLAQFRELQGDGDVPWLTPTLREMSFHVYLSHEFLEHVLFVVYFCFLFICLSHEKERATN